MKFNKLFNLLPILPLILAFAMVPSDVMSKGMASSGKSDTFDNSPMLQFFAAPQNPEVSTVLTAIATDGGDNMGILWIDLYDGATLIAHKECNNQISCEIDTTVTDTLHRTHLYHAKTKDKGSHIVQKDLTIEFEGSNHAPGIYLFVPTDTTPEVNALDTLHFEVWASDMDNDVLEYTWTLDDVLVRGGSTATSWDYTPSINEMGTHEVTVLVEDTIGGQLKGGQDSQTWTVTVLKAQPICTLNFVPPSPITYDQQPFVAICACTNPEAPARLLRENVDVTSENGVPITLTANPTGYDYECDVVETAHYLAASVLRNYIINRAQTILNMNAQPGWSVAYTTTTTVSCSANNAEVIPHLYRNNILVSNPDVQTLAMGSYNYVCNASQSQNWTAGSAANTLTVNQEASQVNLLLNTIDSDLTVIPNQNVTINGTLVVPSAGGKSRSATDAVKINDVQVIQSAGRQTQEASRSNDGTKQGMYHIELWLDSQLIASGDSNLVIVRQFASGIHNVTLVYPGSANYSASSETHFITVGPDTVAPIVNLISPPDNYINGRNITVTYNVTDNADNILDCAIWSDTSGTWQIDTVQQVASGDESSWSYNNLNNGNYIWNVECSDDAGNTAFASANWSFSVVFDDEAPIVVFITPTPANNSVIGIDYVTINTTITDNIAIANVQLEWNGVNETMQNNGTNYHVDKTNLSNGRYAFRVYANDTSGNWGVSETRVFNVNVSVPVHNIVLESLTLQKEVAGVNKSIEASTAYVNDRVYVHALVHNTGNVAESNVNVSLQNNVGLIDSRSINLAADERRLVTFVWNATPEGWHTVIVKTDPIANEINLTDNELSQDVQVWEVCDVIDCSIFGPRTQYNNYTLGQPFLARAMVQNLWNNEKFKDIKIELETPAPYLQIVEYPTTQYINLNESQFAVVNWRINSSVQTGNYTITSWAGNREYGATKNITIN
jgi:hypothetical protein